MHGELNKVRCSNCGSILDWSEDCSTTNICPNCKELGTLRPDVVWFGEMPYHLETIDEVLDYTDIFISIGTSSQVMPANLFATVVSQNGRNASVIEVNPNPTTDGAFNQTIAENATLGVPKLVEQLLLQYGTKAI